MAKFVNAATAAEMISEYTGIELYKLVDIVKEVPAADVAPVVHGHWIICSDGYYPYCSVCKCEPKGREMTKFCGECGAKMDEETDDDKARP